MAVNLGELSVARGSVVQELDELEKGVDELTANVAALESRLGRVLVNSEVAERVQEVTDVRSRSELASEVARLGAAVHKATKHLSDIMVRLDV